MYGAEVANFNVYFNKILKREILEESEKVDVGEWHAQPVDNPMLVSHELRNVTFKYPIPTNRGELVIDIEPNIPWAEDHFLERVNGKPLNPPPSHEWWPWASHNEQHQKGEKFSHTYPERFWPKFAGEEFEGFEDNLDGGPWDGRAGIRYGYGDLKDVVDLLIRSPFTRQAYLPVWFPEDTGAVHGERVPCTLGYHFMIRNGKLDVTYLIRSCDLLRYFQDDVYMACRLAQWMRNQIMDTAGLDHGITHLRPGDLFMWIGSLHVFEGDLARLRAEVKDDKVRAHQP